jgi:hypothetical protein
VRAIAGKRAVPMRHATTATLKRIGIGALSAAAISFNAVLGFAQTEGKPPPAPASTQLETTKGQTTSETKTLKERIGDKASDEQRVDNCKVPADRRGSKPRPDKCE